MKTSLHRYLVAAALGAALVSFSTCAIHGREFEVEHHLEIKRVVNLIPTAHAPANARGTVELEVGHHRSATNKIEIHAFGLAPGAYTVTVFNRAGFDSAVLGSFVSGVNSGDDSVDDHGGHGGDHRGEDDSEHHRRRSGDDNGGHDDDGEAEFSLPTSISAFDLGRISITDGDGVEILAGDVSDISSTSSATVFVQVPVVAGAAEDDASGIASIRGRTRRGRGTATLAILADSLPARTTVHVVINGEDAGTARTDRHGRLRVRRSHRALNVFAISTVSVRDDSGDELLRAQF